jgi:hypothetical protein
LCLCRCDHLHGHQLEALALEALDDATHLRALRACACVCVCVCVFGGRAV